MARRSPTKQTTKTLPSLLLEIGVNSWEDKRRGTDTWLCQCSSICMSNMHSVSSTILWIDLNLFIYCQFFSMAGYVAKYNLHNAGILAKLRIAGVCGGDYEWSRMHGASYKDWWWLLFSWVREWRPVVDCSLAPRNKTTVRKFQQCLELKKT